MAETPKKKTEIAADAPQGSGTPASAPVPTSAPVKAEGHSPTSRELDLQAEIDLLKEELIEAKSGGRGLDDETKLNALVDRLGESIGVSVAKALREERESQKPGAKKPPKRELSDEFKGPRTYIVGAKKAYQNGRLFQQGERITVVDQFPASDWIPVESVRTELAQAAPTKQGRASDQTVG